MCLPILSPSRLLVPFWQKLRKGALELLPDSLGHGKTISSMAAAYNLSRQCVLYLDLMRKGTWASLKGKRLCKVFIA